MQKFCVSGHVKKGQEKLPQTIIMELQLLNITFRDIRFRALSCWVKRIFSLFSLTIASMISSYKKKISALQRQMSFRDDILVNDFFTHCNTFILPIYKKKKCYDHCSTATSSIQRCNQKPNNL